MPEIKYRDIINGLGIAPGSTLMVAADLTRLAIHSRRKEGEFNISAFIESIQHFLGKEGTLVIPAYNFNLGRNSGYDPAKTLPVTGALAVEALKRDDFQRTQHPLHSFLVWGKYASELAGLTNLSSFSQDSPFAFLLEKHCRMLLIDTTIRDAFTFVHFVEEQEKVRYRRYKSINLFIADSQGGCSEKKYLIFAKKPGWILRLDHLEQLLNEYGMVNSDHINGSSFSRLNIADVYPLILNYIRTSGGSNIAFFSTSLFLREKIKQVLAFFGIHTLADRIRHDPGLL